jgi:microsomal epoxide hydrolase
MRAIGTILILLVGFCLSASAQAGRADRFLTTSDGVRLHYVDTGFADQRAAALPILVFVPGWTMPGWIFAPQVQAFSPHYRVVVLDPRGQGSSDVPSNGYTYARRGEDIADLVAALAPQRVVLVGWSLGVLDSLAYVHMHGDTALAGMVLIDNSVGEEPPPPPPRKPLHKAPHQTHSAFMAGFVRGMFHRPQPQSYLVELTEAALRTPEFAASALLSYAVPRSYWREAVYSTSRPILYIVRPGLSGQGANLAAHHPGAETVVVPDLGHAMFVDDPVRFDATVQDFLTRRVGG